MFHVKHWIIGNHIGRKKAIQQYRLRFSKFHMKQYPMIVKHQIGE
jgi:hypothetical protein